MGAWTSESTSEVSTMGAGDFRSNEKSVTLEKATTVRIEHRGEDGTTNVLKSDVALLESEIADSSVMSKKSLVAFLEAQVEEARKSGVLFSLHMKATMMKVSDPIIFGHGVRAYFKELWNKHGATFDEIGVDVKNGFGDLVSRLDELPADKKSEIEADIKAAYESGPGLAMVNSDKGITNLHVPSDVIIDASMPAMIRTSGQMWNAEGKLQDTKAVIPDSSYAAVYSALLKHKKIKPPTYYLKYKVKRGDSLIRIARKHKTTVAVLKKTNRLRNNRIYANRVYKIPKRGGVVQPKKLVLPARRVPSAPTVAGPSSSAPGSAGTAARAAR